MLPCKYRQHVVTQTLLLLLDPQRVLFFRDSENVWPDFGQFFGFLVVLALPVKSAGQNDPEWYRNYSQIRLGGRFLDI